VTSALSRQEHREWRQAERRALRDHNVQQLTTLRSLAASGAGLTSLIYPDCVWYVTSAEFMVAGMRIRAGRVYRPTLIALTRALGCMPTVPLLTAGRYGPFWVLTFDLATAPLAVLADKLFILPDRHGSSASPAVPTTPVDVGHHGYSRRRVEALYGFHRVFPPTMVNLNLWPMTSRHPSPGAARGP
jgi:hypothetical protein